MCPRNESEEPGASQCEEPGRDDRQCALQKLGYRTRVMPTGYRASWGSVQALAIDWQARAVTGVAGTRRSAGVDVST